MKRFRRRLSVEQLDDRIVPAFGVDPPPQQLTVIFAGDTLNVTGDEQNGRITIDVQNGVVHVNDVSTGKTDADIGVISVKGFGGDDDITLRLPQGFQAATTLDGGDGDDELNGHPFGPDTLLGGAGDDVLNGDGSLVNDGRTGDDTLDGGDGNDRLNGGRGSDTYIGSAGEDRYSDSIRPELPGEVNTLVMDFAPLAPVGGVSVVFAIDTSEETDDGNLTQTFPGGTQVTQTISGITHIRLSGTPGADTFDVRGADEAGVVSTVLDGRAGGDLLFGTNASDTLIGGAGDDALSAFGGDDILIPGDGDDLTGGGSGFDTLRNVGTGTGDPSFDIRYAGDVIVTLTDSSIRSESFSGANVGHELFADIDRVELTSRDDAPTTVIVSNFTKALSFDGRGGSDRIVSRGQQRFTLTDAGLRRTTANGTVLPEIALASVERAEFEGTLGNDNMNAKAFSGTTVMSGRAGNDFFDGAAGADVIDGGLGADLVLGNDGNDVIDGGAGDDSLHGGRGNDTIRGGFGDDLIVGGPGSDDLDGGPGTDGILVEGTPGDDQIHISRRTDAEGRTLAVVTVNGETSEPVYVNGETITVFAGAGNDRVGFDELAGQTWTAVFHGGEGDDTLVGGSRNDRLFGGAGTNVLEAGAGQVGPLVVAAGGIVRTIDETGTEQPTQFSTGGVASEDVRPTRSDVTGDGVPDLLTASGPGSPSKVRVVDGVSRAEVRVIEPFEASFTGGAFVATGDLTGDGTPDLVITPDFGGGGRVQVRDGRTFELIADFFGIDDPNFRGGAMAALGDINGDGTPDLIVSAGAGGGPRVAVFDGAALAEGRGATRLIADFFVFEPALRNGASVSAGDLNGDGYADVIGGAGPGGAPRVLALDGRALLDGTMTVLANFFGGDADSRGGIRVTAKDLDGDAVADLVAGVGGRASGYLGKGFAGAGAPAAFDFDAFPGFNGGVFVG